MWKYVFYLVYLDQKDATEFTGLETYVNGLVEDENMDFYPIDQALCMDDGKEEVEEDPFHAEVEEKLVEMENSTSMIKGVLAEIKSEASTNQAQSMGFEKQRFALVKSMLERMDRDGEKLAKIQMRAQVDAARA